MSFTDALRKLNIEDFKQRIMNSNSHGELFHIYDYLMIAKTGSDDNMDWFREWFVGVVTWAEKNWERPESVFQHIPRIIREMHARL